MVPDIFWMQTPVREGFKPVENNAENGSKSIATHGQTAYMKRQYRLGIHQCGKQELSLSMFEGSKQLL